MDSSSLIKSRRRGAELDEAILEGAWAELVESGYADLTMEAVAARVCTSRSVIARRWDGKAALAFSAIQHQLARCTKKTPDLGNVRAELLAHLEDICALAPLVSVVFSVSMDTTFRQSYASPRTLRHALGGGRSDNLSEVLRRAVERGEVDPVKLTAPIDTLLNDLIRHHILMHQSAPAESLRTAWVDAIFLPLVRPG